LAGESAVSWVALFSGVILSREGFILAGESFDPAALAGQI